MPRSERSNHRVGRQGEFLAAYLLETHGIEVHHVDRRDADLWCRVGDRLATVQVKTSAQARVRADRSVRPTHTFSTPGITVDWYCFVSLEDGRLLMRPSDEIANQCTTIKPAEFTEENQRKTIEDFIKSC